jgi:hypothetical protein
LDVPLDQRSIIIAVIRRKDLVIQGSCSVPRAAEDGSKLLGGPHETGRLNKGMSNVDPSFLEESSLSLTVRGCDAS